MTLKPVVIDGAKGEGGGQILRSALSLSAITGRPLKIKNIRAGRSKPGLMRQHLTCVKAAAEICSARVTGAKTGSTELTFLPQDIKSGDYHFAIGTAGSTMLVAQTVLPILMMAEARSTVVLEGGTHNIAAPSYDFIVRSFLPVLRKMGVNVSAKIESYGFFPAGGGRVVFEIEPTQTLKPFELNKHGALKAKSAEILLSKVPYNVAERELAVLAEALSLPDDSLHVNEIKGAHSACNLASVVFEYEHVTEVLDEFGAYSVKAETVAKRLAKKAEAYLNSHAVVGEYLADQLLLPMALAGQGGVITAKPSEHTTTNVNVIQEFLSVKITAEQKKDRAWQIVARER